jgi:molecular chaperone GrpE
MTQPGPNRTAQPPPGTPADQEAAAVSGERTVPNQAANQEEALTGPIEGATEGPSVSGPDAADMEDRWRRAVADLDNLRKRYARELGRERGAERDLVTTSFLPVLDTVDRALEHADADPQSIVEGLRSLREQALAVLAGLGYRREDEVGVPFDPARHEVVGVVDADSGQVAPGAVAQVLRPGYGAPDRQLRPAAVTVAQRPDS